jgi:hypothetical protein
MPSEKNLMKKILLALLLVFSIPIYAQRKSDATPPIEKANLILDVKFGMAGVIVPDFANWSEVYRAAQSPTAFRTLELGGSGLGRLNEKYFVGIDASYLRYQEALNTLDFVQTSLSNSMLISSFIISIVPDEPLKDKALVKITGGLGFIYGSVSENAVLVVNTYHAYGIAALVDFTFGLALTNSTNATINASIRGGFTNNLKNGSGTLQYIDSDRITKPVSLSFISFGLRIGLAWRHSS